MTALNNLAIVPETGEMVPARSQSPAAMLPSTNTPLSPFGSIEAFETAQRMAKALAASTFVPKEFKNNIGDCLILLETASRTGMPIMALMQNMYVVHGKPSMSSAFMAGLINNSKRFDTPLQFKYNKERTSCYAYTTKDGQEYRGITVTMEMAKAEGWSTKNGSKWKTMPELMLQYRATSFFARAYCADLIMGMREEHEVEDEYSKHKEQAQPPGQGLNTIVVDQAKEEKEEAIDAEHEEVVDEGTDDQQVEETPAATPAEKADETIPEGMSKDFQKLFKEALEKESSLDLDQWRSKHHKRISRILADDGQVEAFMKAVEARYQELKGDEAAATEAKTTVDCPEGKGNVQVSYCDEDCKSRPGCPAFEG